MEKFKKTGTGTTNKCIDIDTLLILEKTFETAGQQWVENLNIIEQLLVGIVENIGSKCSPIRANFIVRRLPTYTASFVNKNEYAIIVEDFNFTLTSPHSADADSLQEKAARIALGQVQIFPENSDCSDSPTSSSARTQHSALSSTEFFKKFANAFQKIFTEEAERTEETQDTPKEPVQLIGPHLVFDLKCNSDVQKIFTLTQPNISLSKLKRSNCRLTADSSKAILTIELDGTVGIVRPCLFQSKGYGRLNNSLLERIPLFHPAILCIGESLTKGCFLTPSSSELLWTLQFWPSESHIISTFHPNSIIGRLFKLYGSFCLSPSNFWECLNESFILGVDGIGNSSDKPETHFFGIDFLTSSFLFELEKFPNVEDWSPTNFTTRFMSLVKTAVESFEKGFYPNHFTKANILRGLWRNSSENSDNDNHEEKPSVSRNVAPSIEGSVFDNGDYEKEQYRERYPSDMDELDDDFGFQLDHLSVQDEDKEMGSSSLASRDTHRTVNPFSGLNSGRSSVDAKAASGMRIPAKQKPKSLSRKLGANILRRFSTLNRSRSETSGDKNKSISDIASGFEEMVNQMRREQTINQYVPSGSDSIDVTETSFSQNRNGRSASVASSVELVGSVRHSTVVAFENEAFEPKESIYLLILQYLNEISITEHYSDTDMILHLEKSKKILYSQRELIQLWSQIMEETPRPKYVCPHAFSPRQIQYISLVVQTLSKCSPNNISVSSKGEAPITTKMPSWEISGDILRTVLYQLRSEVSCHDSFKVKEKQRQMAQGIRKFSLKSSKSFSEGTNRNPPGRFSKFSFRKGGGDICKSHAPAESDTDQDRNTQFALDDPETAATHRLLQWLWQLRNSEIGRLSIKAQRYIEALHLASHINSHFIEHFNEQKILRSTAIRSAVAVSRILADEKFLPHIPLLAASKKGWLWAEMVLSLVNWNQDKGIVMKAKVPVVTAGKSEDKFLLREIEMTTMTNVDTAKLNKSKKSEPDSDAATLAFHSELATPLGWNDFEDPRRPGPQTVAILIFSSLGYFNQWELISGNIVQTMVRLQKFNNLQHVGALLYPPHRKTALNEVRKLNKSVSFRTFQFDDNVMTKTFRRLASLRNTRSLFTPSGLLTTGRPRSIFYTCQQIGCASSLGETTIGVLNGKEIECTRF